MGRELTEIERLDLAARAEAIEPFASRAALPTAFLTVIGFWLALGSNASSEETIAAWVFFCVAVSTLLMLLRHWCYAAYGLSILNFLAAVGVLRNPDSIYSRTSLGSFSDQFFLVWFLGNGYAWWKAAAPFVIAHSDSYDNERKQVGQWLSELKYGRHNSEVLEFSVQSFWSGYWTYRLLNLGNCWAVAKFKYHNLRGLAEFRIQAAGGVTAKEQANGKLRIAIGSRPIPDVEAPPESRKRLLCAVDKA